MRIIKTETWTLNSWCRELNLHFLVFACIEKDSPSNARTMRRLAAKISDKNDDNYSNVIANIRTQINFAVSRSSVLCFRGSRQIKTRQKNIVDYSIVAIAEGRLSWFWMCHLNCQKYMQPYNLSRAGDCYPQHGWVWTSSVESSRIIQYLRWVIAKHYSSLPLVNFTP